MDYETAKQNIIKEINRTINATKLCDNHTKSCYYFKHINEANVELFKDAISTFKDRYNIIVDTYKVAGDIYGIDCKIIWE